MHTCFPKPGRNHSTACILGSLFALRYPRKKYRHGDPGRFSEELGIPAVTIYQALWKAGISCQTKRNRGGGAHELL